MEASEQGNDEASIDFQLFFKMKKNKPIYKNTSTQLLSLTVSNTSFNRFFQIYIMLLGLTRFLAASHYIL